MGHYRGRAFSRRQEARIAGDIAGVMSVKWRQFTTGSTPDEQAKEDAEAIRQPIRKKLLADANSLRTNTLAEIARLHAAPSAESDSWISIHEWTIDRLDKRIADLSVAVEEGDRFAAGAPPVMEHQEKWAAWVQKEL